MAQAQDVGSLESFEDGGMRTVEVGGEKVLVIRDGDAIHAVAATCPHAGGPLAQGVRRGDRLVCPWHKATFCLSTGAVLDPPALDPLRRWDARIEAGRVLLSDPPETEHASPEADPRCFVIVGAGAAGAVAAQTLREEGFAGRIVMLDRQNRVPYDRTLLSKYVLSGQKGGEKSPLQPQSFYRDHRIERRTAEVKHVDPGSRLIMCADGSELRYDAALLATGGAPKQPDLPGADLAGVFLLRTPADAQAILAQAERSERAVILGASFIGMEVAASLRERGLEVAVVGRERIPFEKQLGERIGAAFIHLHEQHGVTFHLGADIQAIEGDAALRGVRLKDGELLPADLVVIGFGIRPATAGIDGLSLNEDGGVPVDSRLRAAPGLYAAGDIASFPHRGDGPAVRVEHWRVAEQHGRVAALNMLGRDVPYAAPPVFWTIQYLKRLDYIGHAESWDDIIVHGDTGKPEFLAYYVKDGYVVAAAGLDRDRDTAALVELFTMRRHWRAGELGERPAELLARLG